MHGYWAVGFLDLRGHKDAFLKTDFIPDANDPVRKLIEAVQNSLGVVHLLHDLAADFTDQSDADIVHDDSPLRDLPPDFQAKWQKSKRREVRELRWLDGLVKREVASARVCSFATNATEAAGRMPATTSTV